MKSLFTSTRYAVYLSALALFWGAGCGEHQQFLQPIKAMDTIEDSSASQEPDLKQSPDTKKAPEVDVPAVTEDTKDDPRTGEPCENGSTCSSGICVPSSQGKVCAQPCVDSCPDGWVCQPFQIRNQDPVVICLERAIHLCTPCSTHQDCHGIGAAPTDRCIDFGDLEGSFCGNSCEKTSDCPEGYACEPYTDAQSNEETKQCTPLSGQCTCSPWAITSGAQTPCGEGDCSGVRMCTDDGLSSCSVNANGEEACNAEDDDCDGAIDEGLNGTACEIESGAVTCSGTLSCVAGASRCDVDEYDELCDDKDNDCDNKTDEDFSGLGESCDGDDSDTCANGKYVCTPDGKGLRCTAEGVSDLYESCDDLDNDCDGKTDEAFPELGSPCDGPDDDLCINGAFQCSADGLAVVCGQETPENIPELCDQVDNDCDAKTDEAFPDLGQACDGPDSDNCAMGVAECSADGSETVCESETITNVVEVCDGHDNDCNGTIDDAPGGCGSPDEACEYHTDCYPERVCALRPESNEKLCSAPCAGNSDCTSGEICSKLPGSAQVGFCHAPLTEGGSTGAACALHSDCSSGICFESVCVDFCLNESHCTSTDKACSLVGDSQTGDVFSACINNATNSVITGGNCQGSSAKCETGHCDLTYPGYGPWYCSSLCKSEFDCPAYQECNIVYYDAGQNPGGIPFNEAWQLKTHDSVTACFTPSASSGSLVDGTPCSDHNQCGGHKCFPLIPENAQNFCTSLCSRDSDCITGMQCKMTAMTLVSAWLTNPNLITQGPMPTAYTFVRICKFQ